jgi:putative ABC transport system permease protein
MRNNDTAIIRKITRRALVSDKRRNFFLVTAITLTTFLIASVFSIGVSYYESINMHEKRMQGSVSQMAFSHPTEEQLEKIYSLDYVETVGLGVYAAQTSDIQKFEDLDLVYVDKTQWLKIFGPTFTGVVGEYAEKENEIMLSRYLLNALGIDNPKIGMEIPLSFVVNGTGEVRTERFTLSCIYTEYAHSRQNGFIAIYTSKAFAEKYGKIATDNLMVNLIFKKDKNISENIDRLKNDLEFSDNQAYTESPAYTSTYGNTTTYIALLVIIIFLMFTGYLLIYNVMYISISKEVRFYGMFKTLGTTPRQIRRIVLGQILRLCIIGLPIGCTASAIVSLLIVPAVISNSGIATGPVVSFSPIIYAGAIAFTILTALFGAAAPAKKAANISPIEALKFTTGDVDKINFSPAKKKITYKMAVRNLFRSRKQAAIVMLSLFLGIMIFSIIMTIVPSMDIDYRVNTEYAYDFSIGSKNAFPDYGLDADFVESIRNLKGIAEIGTTTLEFGELNYSKELDQYVNLVSKEYNLSKEEAIEKLLGCGLKGIDSLQLGEINKTLSVPIDVEAFEHGEIAFINSRNGNENDIEIADCFSEVSVLDIKGGEKEDGFQMINGGMVSYNGSGIGSSTSFSGPEILISNSFLQQYFSEPHILSVDINTQSADEESIYNTITDLSKSQEVEMISRYAARKDMQDAKTIMMVLGGGVSLILGLIGIFNFVNVMSVGIITRKQELATLESIGMSKAQLKSMLKKEGIGYAVITIICCLTIGNLLNYIIFLLIKNVAAYARFTYPFLAIFLMYLIIAMICFSTPEIVYRSISKKTLVERLREGD